MNTIYLATLIGWYLVIMSLFLFLRQDQAKLVMTEVMKQHGLFFFTAVLTLILGLLMVTSHNVWVMGWPVVVTVFSWLVLIGGLIRLFFPESVINYWKKMMKHENYLHVTAAITLLIGLYLLMHVYLTRPIF